MEKLDAADVLAMRERVAAELRTTFASRCTKVISLAETLRLDHIAAYNRRATGQKYLINPHLDAGPA